MKHAARSIENERSVRLQRVLADAGVASRRACEAMIEAGRVEVNGQVVESLPVFVDPNSDRIAVDGRPLRPLAAASPSKAKEAGGKPAAGMPGTAKWRPGTNLAGQRLIYVMLNKPERVVTTVSDQADLAGGGTRTTVMDLVNHPSGARLYPVGRLDYGTRGLVLLTNDGELANKLTHPRYGVHKTYRAVVRGVIADDAIASLQKGIYLAERKDGRTRKAARTAEVELRIVKRERERTHLDVTLREGRNRQVRRMFAKVGHPVKTLTRIGMGPLRLREVAPGQWRELEQREIHALRKAASRQADNKAVGDAGNPEPRTRQR